MFLLFQWGIFRFHVGFGGVYLHISTNSWFIYKNGGLEKVMNRSSKLSWLQVPSVHSVVTCWLLTPDHWRTSHSMRLKYVLCCIVARFDLAGNLPNTSTFYIDYVACTVNGRGHGIYLSCCRSDTSMRDDFNMFWTWISQWLVGG